MPNGTSKPSSGNKKQPSLLTIPDVSLGQIDERVYVNHPTRPKEYIGRITKIPTGYRAVSFSEAISATRIMDDSKPLPLAAHAAVVRRTAPLARFYIQHRWQAEHSD